VFEALAAAQAEQVALTPRAQWALEWWLYLDGYRPERLPAFAALYEIGDVDELLTYLRTIRDVVNAPPRRA
jgi:hypothetical protein